MNLTELSENLGMDEEEFLEIVEIFITANTADIDRLQSGINENNMQQVAEAAHSIKGASTNLGFMKIQEAAKIIEERGRTDSLEGIAELTRVLKKEMGEVEKLAQKWSSQ